MSGKTLALNRESIVAACISLGKQGRPLPFMTAVDACSRTVSYRQALQATPSDSRAARSNCGPTETARGNVRRTIVALLSALLLGFLWQPERYVLPTFRQRVRDSLVAIYTGFAAFNYPFECVSAARAVALRVEVHVLEFMTITALA